MKKLIALVPVISFVVAIPGDLVAKERRGAELIIETKDGHYKGQIIAEFEHYDDFLEEIKPSG